MACRGLGGRLANAAPPPFPFKLYDLVEAAVERGICSWTSTEFVVWDKELLRCAALCEYIEYGPTPAPYQSDEARQVGKADEVVPSWLGMDVGGAWATPPWAAEQHVRGAIEKCHSYQRSLAAAATGGGF